MTVNMSSIKTVVREAEGELREKILNFVGEIPSNFGIVVKETKSGVLFKHGEPCSLNMLDYNGCRAINLRCLGSFAGNNTNRAFVVWFNSRKKRIVVAEYVGKDLFPESFEDNWLERGASN